MIWKKILIAQFSTVTSPMAALSLTCLLDEKHSFTCLLKFLVIVVVLHCTVLQQIELTSRQLRKEKISLTDLVTSALRKSNRTVNWWCVVRFNIWLSVGSLLLLLVKTKTKYQTAFQLQREIRKCKHVKSVGNSLIALHRQSHTSVLRDLAAWAWNPAVSHIAEQLHCRAPEENDAAAHLLQPCLDLFGPLLTSYSTASKQLHRRN